MSNKVVGHKTMVDGSHVPLYEDEAKMILELCEAERKKREADMPTEQDAIKALWQAHQRLKELGWRDAIYCPKDGTVFDAIEAGSSGIHDCSYWGEWPKGSWNVYADDDIWPARPILFKLKEPKEAGE